MFVSRTLGKKGKRTKENVEFFPRRVLNMILGSKAQRDISSACTQKQDNIDIREESDMPREDGIRRVRFLSKRVSILRYKRKKLHLVLVM